MRPRKRLPLSSPKNSNVVVGRKRRLGHNQPKTNVKFELTLSAPEYLALHEIAAAEGCSMAEYVRVALHQRYTRENPTKLGFGEPYRVDR